MLTCSIPPSPFTCEIRSSISETSFRSQASQLPQVPWGSWLSMDNTIWTLTKLPEKNPTDLRAQIVPTEHNFWRDVQVDMNMLMKCLDLWNYDPGRFLMLLLCRILLCIRWHNGWTSPWSRGSPLPLAFTIFMLLSFCVFFCCCLSGGSCSGNHQVRGSG